MKRFSILLAVAMLLGCLGFMATPAVTHAAIVIQIGPPESLDVYYDGPFDIDGIQYWYYGGAFYTFDNGRYYFHHRAPAGRRGFYENHWRSGHGQHQERFRGGRGHEVPRGHEAPRGEHRR